MQAAQLPHIVLLVAKNAATWLATSRRLQLRLHYDDEKPFKMKLVEPFCSKMIDNELEMGPQDKVYKVIVYLVMSGDHLMLVVMVIMIIERPSQGILEKLTVSSHQSDDVPNGNCCHPSATRSLRNS